MALKVTQRELKKKFRLEIAELKLAIRLKCADCLGFFIDEWQPCPDKHCPLRRWYPGKGMAQKSPKFKQAMIELAKKRGNHLDFVAEIGNAEAKPGPVEARKSPFGEEEA